MKRNQSRPESYSILAGEPSCSSGGVGSSLHLAIPSSLSIALLSLMG